MVSTCTRAKDATRNRRHRMRAVNFGFVTIVSFLLSAQLLAAGTADSYSSQSYRWRSHARLWRWRYRSLQKVSIGEGRSAVALSAIETSPRTLLGGKYRCKYSFNGNRGVVSFKLKSSQSINVWKITEVSLLDNKFECSSERFNNFSRPAKSSCSQRWQQSSR